MMFGLSSLSGILLDELARALRSQPQRGTPGGSPPLPRSKPLEKTAVGNSRHIRAPRCGAADQVNSYREVL